MEYSQVVRQRSLTPLRGSSNLPIPVPLSKRPENIESFVNSKTGHICFQCLNMSHHRLIGLSILECELCRGFYDEAVRWSSGQDIAFSRQKHEFDSRTDYNNN